MALITTKQATLAGVSVAIVSAAGGGDEFINPDQRSLLIVRTSSAPSTTVSITPGSPPSGLAFAAVTLAVSGTTWNIFGPFIPKWFNDANNRVAVGYSQATGILVSVVRV